MSREERAGESSREEKLQNGPHDAHNCLSTALRSRPSARLSEAPDIGPKLFDTSSSMPKPRRGRRIPETRIARDAKPGGWRGQGGTWWRSRWRWHATTARHSSRFLLSTRDFCNSSVWKQVHGKHSRATSHNQCGAASAVRRTLAQSWRVSLFRLTAQPPGRCLLVCWFQLTRFPLHAHPLSLSVLSSPYYTFLSELLCLRAKRPGAN